MFDPYHKWLGILPKDQPPNHYRLLAVEIFEGDLDVLEGAAEQRMSFIRQYQSGEHSSAAAKILNELATARLCLLKPVTKAAYDEKLRRAQPAAESEMPTIDLSFADTDRLAGRKPTRTAKKRANSPPANSSQILLVAGGAAGIVCLVVIALLLRGGSKPQSKPFESAGFPSDAARKPDQESVAAKTAVSTTPANLASNSGTNQLPDTETEPVASLRWDFRGDRPEGVLEWGSRKVNSAEPLSDGMKIVRGAKIDESDQCIGYIIRGLSGDFELTLDYRDFKSTPVLTDWRVPRIDISAVIHSSVDVERNVNTFGTSHRRNQNGELVLVVSQGDRGADDQFTWKSADAPTTRDSGRLHLVRRGTTMFYQSASLGSDEWQTIQCLPVDSGPVRWITLGLRAEDLEAGAEVVLTNLTIRASQIQLK